MGRWETLRSKHVLGIVAVGLACVGCFRPDLGTSVAHKPHPLIGLKKGGGADLDLLPAPPGMQTGTPAVGSKANENRAPN